VYNVRRWHKGEVTTRQGCDRMVHIKAIILAAGSGTRMCSKKGKVLHEIGGKPLINHVIESVKEAGIDQICVIVGHQKEAVQATITESVTFVEQKELLGTGHGVMQADAFIETTGKTLVLFGDTPLITSQTLKKMIENSERNSSDVTVLSTIVEEPKGYGRIIRDTTGAFLKSVEDKDATDEERKVCEINSGMYCFDSKQLKEALKLLTNDNQQKEYYLPDCLEIIQSKGGHIQALITKKQEEILGINTRIQLAQASKIMQKRINEAHMLEGVTLIDPATTYIGKEVILGQDTIIYPNTFLEGATQVGEDCRIGPNTKLVNTVVGNRTQIQSSTVLESQIGHDTVVGPYAYIRPNSMIGNHIKIGDFVEIKNATIGDKTKISHLTYVGDADVGSQVNFGCGTVVVNYDGQKKHRAIIEDQAFIGCNTNLVSPVTVHQGAYTAAGSTITGDVPALALAIARSRQTNIDDWVKRKK